MNETERLILENQMVIMQVLGDIENSREEDLKIQFGKTQEKLAPQSDEMGFKKDIEEDTQSCSSKSVEGKE